MKQNIMLLSILVSVAYIGSDITYPLGISALSWSSSESTVGLEEAGLVAPLVRAYPSVAVEQLNLF